jgi:hypothetical protein
MVCLKRNLMLLSAIFIILGNLCAEVFPNNNGFDKYGGYLGIKANATGRFHLKKVNDRQFLITPDGHGFLSIGVTHTGGIHRPEGSKCDYFKDECGGDWHNANDQLLSHFRNWGYNSLGYDNNVSTRQHLPHFGSCYPTGKTSLWLGKGIVFPDVFSDAWKKEARKAIERMAQQYKGNSNLIGVYWTDMPAWDLNIAKRETGKNWVDAIRELPEGTAGKKRYQQFLKKNGESATDEDFIVVIAKEVYSYVGPLTKELLPNTLIFGDRYAGKALPFRVIKEALPYIDVISVQPNGTKFPKSDFDKLYSETGKPIMICDHQASFKTAEHKVVMWQSLPSVEAVGKAHAKYLNEGFSTPYLIGYNRCMYIDRLQHKRGKDILKQGLLQADGKPYPGLAKTVEENNWRIHSLFIKK